MRWVTGGVALVLVVLALVLHRTSGGRAVDPEEQGEALAQPEPERAADVDLAGTLAPATPDDLVAAEAAPPSALGESAAHAESAGPTGPAPFLHGTVVVRDGWGREHRAESGHFVLLLWTRSGARGVTVDVRSGAWSVAAAEVTDTVEAISLQGFQLGMRPAVGDLDLRARLPLPSDGRMDLSVRWPPRLTLHVRGNEGADRVLLFQPEERDAHGLAHPGDLAWTARSHASPLVLDAPSSGTRTVYVGAEGHAWERVEVRAEEAVRALALQPGGDLRVRVQGQERDPGTLLRVFATGSPSPVAFAEVPLGLAGSIKLEGLPAGAYVVAAHLGERWAPRVRGSVETRIQAGETSEVTLVID